MVDTHSISSKKYLCLTIAVGILLGASGLSALAWPYAAGEGEANRSAPLQSDMLARLRPDPEGFVFFGDMAYKFEDLQRLGFSGRKWPNGIVPIAFHSNVSPEQQTRFFQACAEWTRVARVRCIKRTNEADFVQVESGPGNWSQVGRRGGMQRLQMFNWEWKYIIAHEIAHALGAGHEQNRPDRNQYVQIHLENMLNPQEVGHNFTILQMGTYNEPYDFASIMHYPPYAFSKNGLPTISPRQGYEEHGAYMGNRAALSQGDADNMRRHYGAPGPLSDLIASAGSNRTAAQTSPNRSGAGGMIGTSPQAVWEDQRLMDNIGKMGPDDKVFDGSPVASGSLKDVVGITERDSNVSSCTGTLISPTVVLTAKHCVCGGVNGQILIGEKDASAQRISVSRSVPEVEQCSRPITAANLDLGLLVLSQPVTGVATRHFAVDDHIDKAYSYRVVGFGYHDREDGGLGAGEKRQTVVPSASNDCKGRPSGWTIPDSEAYGCKRGAEIVAGSPGLGRDTCNGDSGGPLFVGPDFHGGLGVPEGDLRLAGVTSRAIRLATGHIPCGDGGIYVRITQEVRDWIRSASQ